MELRVGEYKNPIGKSITIHKVLSESVVFSFNREKEKYTTNYLTLALHLRWNRYTHE